MLQKFQDLKEIISSQEGIRIKQEINGSVPSSFWIYMVTTALYHQSQTPLSAKTLQINPLDPNYEMIKSDLFKSMSPMYHPLVIGSTETSIQPIHIPSNIKSKFNVAPNTFVNLYGKLPHLLCEKGHRFIYQPEHVIQCCKVGSTHSPVSTDFVQFVELGLSRWSDSTSRLYLVEMDETQCIVFMLFSLLGCVGGSRRGHQYNSQALANSST
ncbi:hypothetical protein DFA_09065 [Cavenderia fasciculata]|uniref:Uncharacterized protein n=1 Tax=Cavenderia fasciculata TaxID=261658 RepID=F4Q6L2_CACFS|nr:uncharacterized protein DFA_09065 [Cavenderia fasciculata]EGG16522.1 hypothetical protein DFA_09065 [Cavenderia fasciculata]|eukprot:XP_004354922.1 hypothetical protein DFA_09065 [Cavenderia fasciculata]